VGATPPPPSTKNVSKIISKGIQEVRKYKHSSLPVNAHHPDRRQKHNPAPAISTKIRVADLTPKQGTF